VIGKQAIWHDAIRFVSCRRRPLLFNRATNLAIALLTLSASAVLRAEDIVGVQPAALDQPRVYLNVRRTESSSPLAAKADGQASSAIEAFLDTGASALVVSDETYKALGIGKETASASTTQPSGSGDAEYEDVGVGGSEKSFISEPLFVSTAPYSSATDGSNENGYCKPIGPLRAELRASSGVIEMLTGGMDVAGMPLMAGKVAMIDPKPLNTFADKLRTTVLSSDDARIPKVACHVPLTYVAFDNFTRCTPGATPPTTGANPMIGPNPFNKDDHAKPVYVRFNGKTEKLTMLLDTGAVCSMISTKQAALLGVKYSADGKKLIGVPEKEQFQLTVGGIGGSKSAVGFYLEKLALPTEKGEPAIIYGKAPVLVNDITVMDPKTQQTFTLDGVFGMNFLVAGANITGGLLPDLGQLTQGPFTMIVIDHSRKFLGVNPR
jgi:hypothetical protein